MPNQQPINMPLRYDQQNRRSPNHSGHAEQRRKALEAVKSVFENKKQFSGKFERHWGGHCNLFLNFCQVSEIMDHNKTYFLQYTLTGDDVLFQESIATPNSTPWIIVVQSFNERDAIEAKQQKISSRL